MTVGICWFQDSLVEWVLLWFSCIIVSPPNWLPTKWTKGQTNGKGLNPKCGFIVWAINHGIMQCWDIQRYYNVPHGIWQESTTILTKHDCFMLFLVALGKHCYSYTITLQDNCHSNIYCHLNIWLFILGSVILMCIYCHTTKTLTFQ